MFAPSNHLSRSFNAPGTARRARTNENAGVNLPAKTPVRAPLGGGSFKPGPGTVGRPLGLKTLERNVLASKPEQPLEDIGPKKLFKNAPTGSKPPVQKGMKTPGPNRQALRTPAPQKLYEPSPLPLPSAQRTRRRSRSSLSSQHHSTPDQSFATPGPAHRWDEEVSLDSILEADIAQDAGENSDYELEYAPPSAKDIPFVPEWASDLPDPVESMKAIAAMRPVFTYRAPPPPPDIQQVEMPKMTLGPDEDLEHPLLRRKAPVARPGVASSSATARSGVASRSRPATAVPKTVGVSSVRTRPATTVPPKTAGVPSTRTRPATAVPPKTTGATLKTRPASASATATKSRPATLAEPSRARSAVGTSATRTTRPPPRATTSRAATRPIRGAAPSKPEPLPLELEHFDLDLDLDVLGPAVTESAVPVEQAGRVVEAEAFDDAATGSAPVSVAATPDAIAEPTKAQPPSEPIAQEVAVVSVVAPETTDAIAEPTAEPEPTLESVAQDFPATEPVAEIVPDCVDTPEITPEVATEPELRAPEHAEISSLESANANHRPKVTLTVPDTSAEITQDLDATFTCEVADHNASPEVEQGRLAVPDEFDPLPVFDGFEAFELTEVPPIVPSTVPAPIVDDMDESSVAESWGPEDLSFTDDVLAAAMSHCTMGDTDQH